MAMAITPEVPVVPTGVAVNASISMIDNVEVSEKLDEIAYNSVVSGSNSTPFQFSPAGGAIVPVSYTHLTLPTICSV